MNFDLHDYDELKNPLLLYDLHAQTPDWDKCFFVQKPYLYGKKGLQDGIAYLDSVLSSNCGPATREKYQTQRNLFQVALDDKLYVDRDCDSAD